MQEMMNAVRIHEFGEPEVLIYEAAPKPVPMGDEVLIRVHAAESTPSIVKPGAARVWPGGILILSR